MWPCLLASQTVSSNQRVQPSTPIDPLFSLLPTLIKKPDSHEIGQPLWGEQAIKHAAFSKAMLQFLRWHHRPGASNSGFRSHCDTQDTQMQKAHAHRRVVRRNTLINKKTGIMFTNVKGQLMNAFLYSYKSYILECLLVAVWVKCQFRSVAVLRLASYIWHICSRA